jgi:hypothetical protein
MLKNVDDVKFLIVMVTAGTIQSEEYDLKQQVRVQIVFVSSTFVFNFRS